MSLKLDSLTRGPVTYYPVVPGRLEFAMAVRRHILRERPDVVAVELPASLEKHYLAAVDRLPEISVLVYPDDELDALDPEDGEDASSQGIFVPIEPADPFTEAVRTAREVGAEVLFATRFRRPSAHPRRLSRPVRPAATAHRKARRALPRASYAAHAAGIAWRLQGANPEQRVLAVVSLNLLDPILDAMGVPQDPPARKPRLSARPVDLVNVHPDCLVEITV